MKRCLQDEGAEMKRTILAYLEIDDDLDFEKIDDGPIAYLEKESGWLAQSGIFITDAAIVDVDAADPKEAYLVYLARFAFDHLSDGNICPMSYEKWRSKYLGTSPVNANSKPLAARYIQEVVKTIPSLGSIGHTERSLCNE